MALVLRITRGEFAVTPVKITIPEGSTVRDIATILGKNMPHFAVQDFLAQAEHHEGYLFPDTYFFSPLEKPEAIIARLRGSFDRAFAPYTVALTAKQRTVGDIIIMASIIEREAKADSDRPIVAGILWKRFDLGIPLQVDAPFYYTLRKTSRELTQDDLRTDTPYNTYARKGLPATPISNPGLEAITAALFPEESPYLYYLSDKNGELHYAKDLEGHKKNREKYLN